LVLLGIRAAWPWPCVNSEVCVATSLARVRAGLGLGLGLGSGLGWAGLGLRSWFLILLGIRAAWPRPCVNSEVCVATGLARVRAGLGLGLGLGSGLGWAWLGLVPGNWIFLALGLPGQGRVLIPRCVQLLAWLELGLGRGWG